MHKLTEELYNTHSDGSYITLHIDNADKIITAYLRERADWLMNSCLHKNGRSSVELIEQAFELSEKCCCGEPETPNVVHRKDNPCYVNTLPSKINISEGSYGEMRAINTINEIIDFLHSKEAQ